jgi:FAD binding domain
MGSPRVLVVGGGIAGLAAAGALLRRGIGPDVVERAAAWSQPGAGMYLPASSVRALGALGLQAALPGRACVITRQRFLDHPGRELVEVDLSAVWSATGPCAAIGRRGLHQILREGIPVRLGTTVTALDDQGRPGRAGRRRRPRDVAQHGGGRRNGAGGRPGPRRHRRPRPAARRVRGATPAPRRVRPDADTPPRPHTEPDPSCPRCDPPARRTADFPRQLPGTTQRPVAAQKDLAPTLAPARATRLPSVWSMAQPTPAVPPSTGGRGPPDTTAQHPCSLRSPLDSCSWTPRGGSGSGSLARRGTATLVMANCTGRLAKVPRSRPFSRDRTRCPRCPASRCTTRCRHRQAVVARVPRRARPIVRIRPQVRPGALHPRARCRPARQDAPDS